MGKMKQLTNITSVEDAYESYIELGNRHSIDSNEFRTWLFKLDDILCNTIKLDATSYNISSTGDV